MSIEYFVEGKVTSQTEGNQTSFSKGNIVHNSIKNINQKGTDTGVSYNQPHEVNPDDKPVNTIDVSLNLFFDGTQNNKSNTESGKDHENSNHEDDSYTNDYSNVARGFDAIDPNAENQVSWYVEGIGTEDGKSESIIFTTKPNNSGIPLGTGSRGVPGKVTKGCIKGAEALKNYAGKDIHLKVNVFGFSRGATAARHFLHVATQPARVLKINNKKGMALAPLDDGNNRIEVKQNDPLVLQHGYFGACLSFWEIIPQKITFNFVGLYDTVASYGLDHRGKKIGSISIIDDDTKQLGLNAVSKAYFTLQLAADDEFRDNFDLTNIDSSAVKGLQFTLPGVHSDIGGCYVNGAQEQVDIYKEVGNYGHKAENYRRILINEGWYKDTNQELHIDYEKRYNRLGEVEGGGTSLLVGKRVLFNTYDKIPLHTMFHYSKQDVFGVKYRQKKIDENKISDNFLNNVHSQLINYMNACNTMRSTYIEEYNKSNSSGDYLAKLKAMSYLDYIDFEDLKTLRNRYLHWSASVTKFGLGPKVGEVTNGKERKRYIQNG